MPKVYPRYEFGVKKSEGTCLICKERLPRRFVKDKRGKAWPVYDLTQIWVQANWFRGDDELIGVVCPDCKRGKGPQELAKML